MRWDTDSAQLRKQSRFFALTIVKNNSGHPISSQNSFIKIGQAGSEENSYEHVHTGILYIKTVGNLNKKDIWISTTASPVNYPVSTYSTKNFIKIGQAV